MVHHTSLSFVWGVQLIPNWLITSLKETKVPLYQNNQSTVSVKQFPFFRNGARRSQFRVEFHWFCKVVWERRLMKSYNIVCMNQVSLSTNVTFCIFNLGKWRFKALDAGRQMEICADQRSPLPPLSSSPSNQHSLLHSNHHHLHQLQITTFNLQKVENYHSYSSAYSYSSSYSDVHEFNLRIDQLASNIDGGWRDLQLCKLKLIFRGWKI